MEEGQVLLGVDTPQMNSFHSGGRGKLRHAVLRSLNPASPHLDPSYAAQLGTWLRHCASVSSVELLGFLTLRVPKDRWSI